MPNPKNPNHQVALNADKWVDEYGDYLYRYALIRVNNKKIAEDLVQETFLSALKAKDRFEGQSSERTWFTTILKNKIIDYYRRAEHQYREYPDKQQDDPEESDFQQEGEMPGFWRINKAPEDWGEHPEEALHQKEFMRILQECIAELPKRLARVFTLREIDQEDSDAICKQLEITSSNLWVMLHRARHQLRKCLEINWFGMKPESV